ncbi:MAG: glycoside hydrolase, partial [Acidobacteria bacterium]|nr:glycoside hydrolase [Acidobacteriota bacterium]
MKKLAFLLLLAAALPAAAQIDPGMYGEMRWRMIGPFRGGRTVAAVGVVKQPNVFYIGVNNGGVWRSNDYGRIWTPIFDDQPSGSIGAIGISQSDPNIIYVGSGEGLQRPDLATGDGMYKSTDAGKTWTHLGLREAQQIPTIVVDPNDPNRLFVAVLGHPYGPNEERGIFRSTDGGRSFQRVLYKNDLTGGIDVILDPSNAQTVYAALWQAQQGPWENAYFGGAASGLFKSTDGGTTWNELKSGLPSSDVIGRIGIEVSQADPKRLYAICGTDAKSGALYRSNDGGATWNRANTDERIWGRPGDFNEVRTDPKNADVVYVANVVTWKSTDGGKTFASFRGAPGGDDYHRVWINPNDTKTILIASDQGAIVTVNGGETWSSWYNQPTAQMFHVNADNAFPYRVCGGQQESGSACVASRGDDGAITFREWHPVGVEEYGYAVPDPLDPDIIFGGKISRTDRRTGETKDITPKPLRKGNYRTVRTAPVVFSMADPHALFFASNTVWKTTNGGESWTEISPDLARKTWTVPESARGYVNTPMTKVTQRGVVYALAPSPLDINTLWAGTDDGLIHVTRDGGKTWNDVTPSELKPWAKVSVLEPSHFDANEAYAAINTIRLDELHPHIYRT